MLMNGRKFRRWGGHFTELVQERFAPQVSS
jgi:hypothetical protein